MKNTYTLNGNIIVELGGMQITRDQLDAVKRADNFKTDQEAVDYLISCAERAFKKELERSEYMAESIDRLVMTGGDPFV